MLLARLTTCSEVPGWTTNRYLHRVEPIAAYEYALGHAR